VEGKAGKDGFINTDLLYDFAQKLGFNADQITWAIDRSARKGLIERSSRTARHDDHAAVRVTSIGIYTVRILAALFTYLDAMAIDTPIVEQSYSMLINDVHSLSDRIRRAEAFRVYLDRQWRKLESTLSNPPFDWREHSTSLVEQVEEITRRAQRT
jgi:hypothetical protein